MRKPQTDPGQSCVPLAQSQKKLSSQNTAQLRLLKSRGNHKRRALAAVSPESEKGKLRRSSRDRRAYIREDSLCVECRVNAFPDRGGSC